MNNDIIRYLPDSVANQIAAGEVIQRPASVIKELVENAVDAGASEISIIIKDAGRTLIQIIDNGSGMSPTDARMAFERHATSKIAAADDLLRLRTMGFRGEALPSVAAVAQIDLRTMRRGDSIGTRLQISESKFEGSEPVACAPGTNIMVKNIFFHMPARRKFLKKDSIELGHILREFERLALVNTGVTFTLTHNDVTLHQVLAGNFKQRIAALFGKTMESQLAPVETETSLVKISGFVALPPFAKRRGAQQFFFVNGRNMRHLFFHKTVMRCYEQLIPADCQASYFLNFEVDPSTIDVNIHPQKHEIKFEHELAVNQILEAAVRDTLGHARGAATLDFDSDHSPEIPLFAPDPDAPVPSDGDFNPFGVPEPTEGGGGAAHSGHPGAFGTRSFGPASPVRDWQSLYESFESKRTAPADPVAMGFDIEGDTTSTESAHSITPGPTAAPGCFQVQGRFIATPTAGGLMLIHQHRAQVRILFERFIQTMADGPMPGQQLIFQEDIELSPAQSAILAQNKTLVADLGFAVSQSSSTIWTIEAVPAAAAAASPAEILTSVLDDLANAATADKAALRAPAALAMARNAAIKPGQPLSGPEMESIIGELFRCQAPNHTPDGLPTIAIIDSDQISRLFQ